VQKEPAQGGGGRDSYPARRTRTCPVNSRQTENHFLDKQFRSCAALAGLCYLSEISTAGLGRIKADGPPTDYFPKEEFDAIIDATYAGK
jgi:hypothetical protein